MEILNIAWLSDGRVAVQVHHPRATDAGLRRSWWTVSGESAVRLTKGEEAPLQDSGLSESTEAVRLETSETGRLFERDAAGNKQTTIFQDLNRQLADIAAAQSMNFEYKSATGATLHANLLLPYGYVRGKHYPTVVWVYAGDIHTADEKPPGRDEDDFLNLALLTGRGYGVLKPSMPISPVGESGDPMLHLADGVDPAIDRAIEFGIIDKDRIALMGHSYGGYSVLGLLTETNRYRAGIALMGLYDLPMDYGRMIPSLRYSFPEGAASIGPWFAEWEQNRMGVAPWINPERYVRNSPFFFANKITTPLLLVSGDLDDIGEQSDVMFTALYRQGKRVEYVRYLGESHVLEAPANILDMWIRIASLAIATGRSGW
jgi:dipeptidyl aminopeptidase/acylaminoacyl peptidase